MIMKKILPLITVLALVLTLSGCKNSKGGMQNTADPFEDITDSVTESSQTQVSSADISGMEFELTDRDKSGDYNASDASRITLSGSKVSASGNGVTCDSSGAKITSAGTYIVSGSAEDISLTVETSADDKIQIVLNGVSLSNSKGPAIYIKSADKVFITLASGSVNTISDGSSYSLSDGGTTLDAALFSKDDLTLNGNGELSVSGNYKHGIVSKDDLVISSGKISVKAKKVAISGKDCVKVSDCTLTLTAGGDGIRSDNTEDADCGYIYLEKSKLNITSGNDGIQASTVLKTTACEINVKSGGGSSNVSYSSGSDRNFSRGFVQSSQNTNTGSAKGLKAGSDIIINDGVFNINSADDSIHSNGTITVTAGNFDMSSGDDGIHADTDLAISGGTVNISKSYEGIEAGKIVISGGKISVTASDDGINAVGGNDSSAMGGRPGQGTFTRDSGEIVISGGYIMLNASGDGLDSNGTVTISGGVTLVSGPENGGNGAIDYESSASVTGGVLIATGSSGMAMNLSDADNQVSMLISTGSQSGGRSIAVCDKSGKVLASFTPSTAYQTAVISAPGITVGNSYSIYIGANVSGADENGYATGTKLSGGTLLETVTPDSNIYGSSQGMGGGMGGGGGHGGGMQRPGW